MTTSFSDDDRELILIAASSDIPFVQTLLTEVVEHQDRVMVLLRVALGDELRRRIELRERAAQLLADALSSVRSQALASSVRYQALANTAVAPPGPLPSPFARGMFFQGVVRALAAWRR